MEVWTDIKGYEGLYQVSNMGNVKTFNMYGWGKIGLLKPCKNGVGYLTVSLCKNNKKSYAVHKLVSMSFLPKVQGKNCINHINGIKTDNRVENLEWCTQKENVQHGFKVLGVTRTQQQKDTIARISKEKFSKRVRRSDGAEYYSIKEASRENKVCYSGISRAIKNKISSAGYKWSIVTV